MKTNVHVFNATKKKTIKKTLVEICFLLNADFY